MHEQDGHAPLPEFEEAGHGNAVLLIPGMEGARQFWKHQIGPLSQRYRVLACSYVRRSPSRSTSIEVYAADFLRLLDARGIQRAALVGESMGGLIAQHLALAHPDRVGALVLCNTTDSVRRFAFGFNTFTVATAVHPLAFVTPRPLQKRMLRWVGRHRGLVLDPSPGNERLADYLLEHAWDPGLRGYADRLLAGIRSPTTGRLPTIRARTLVLRGTEDRLVGPDAVVELVGRIPHAELVLIDGGGHCCQYTRPEETNRALLDWLERIGY